MPIKDKVIMNAREREQLLVFTKLLAGEITQKEAGQILGMTRRWISTKFKRFRQRGAVGLTHKGRGKPSSRVITREVRSLIIELLSTTWKDFGPTFTSEKLLQYHQIRISKETVRQIMKEEKLWEAGERKPKHRRRRPRKALLGLMLQLDGSPHDWFESRSSQCTLLVYIDDATSRFMWLEFVKSESLRDIANATRNYFETHGLPVSFYVDNGSVFNVNSRNSNQESLTQFERAMTELDIQMIHARSPQAKGRVERANRTLQDRLVKEMRLAQISSIEEANAWLQAGDYIASHNASFAVPSAEEGNAHRSSAEYDLDNTLCIKATRVVTNDFTISYNRHVFQLEKKQPVRVRSKDRVMVHEHLDGSVTIHFKEFKLSHSEIPANNLRPEDHVKWERKREKERTLQSQ